MLFVYYLVVFEMFHLLFYGIYRLTRKIPLLGAIYEFFERIGVYFHEISHIIMIKMTSRTAMIIKVRIEGGGGSVTPSYPNQKSFLQAIFVGFSPLILGTELILLITYMFTVSGMELLIFMRILLFIIGCSIVIVISPSWQDAKTVLINFWEYPISAIRQLLFLVIAWVLQIEVMEYFNLIANTLLEFPIMCGILGMMELLFALLMRVLRLERNWYSHSRVSAQFTAFDPVVQNYIAQDLRNQVAKMTATDDLAFKQRFAALMDAFVQANLEK